MSCAAGERVAQLAEQLQAAARVAVPLAGVELGARPVPLGLVHRDVGVPEQRLAVLRVLGVQRDADAGVDLEGEPVDHEALFERPARSARRRPAAARASGSRAANSSPPRRARTSPSRSADCDARPELGEHEIAGVVAERVVELLEVVEIDAQQRQLAAGEPRRRRSPPAGGGGTSAGSAGRSARRCCACCRVSLSVRSSRNVSEVRIMETIRARARERHRGCAEAPEPGHDEERDRGEPEGERQGHRAPAGEDGERPQVAAAARPRAP